MVLIFFITIFFLYSVIHSHNSRSARCEFFVWQFEKQFVVNHSNGPKWIASKTISPFVWMEKIAIFMRWETNKLASKLLYKANGRINTNSLCFGFLASTVAGIATVDSNGRIQVVNKPITNTISNISFKCDVCGLMFSHLTLLNHHKRIHTQDGTDATNDQITVVTQQTGQNLVQGKHLINDRNQSI